MGKISRMSVVLTTGQAGGARLHSAHLLTSEVAFAPIFGSAHQGCGKVFGAWEPIICAWKYA